MSRALALALGVFAAVLSPIAEPAPAAECANGVAPRTELGRRFALPRTISTATPYQEISHQAENQSAAYVRALLQVETPAPGRQWYLVIRDGIQRPVQILTAAEFDGVERRWTARVPGSRAAVQLFAPAGSPVKLKLVEYLAMPSKSERPYYSLRNPGAPAWIDLYDRAAPNDAKALGDGVGMLIAGFGNSVWCCSGVLVAPDLLLTNWHCGGDERVMGPAGFWSDDVWRGALIDFSWDADGISREYLSSGVVAKSRALDYALLRVRAVSDVGGIPPARLSAAPAAAGASVYVIHHPQCLPKRLSHQCTVRQAQRPGWFAEDGSPAPQSDFAHACDTEGGSSGAPIFVGGKLVGLHHLGFALDEQCRATDDLNKAVGIQHIVADIARQAPDAAAQLRLE